MSVGLLSSYFGSQNKLNFWLNLNKPMKLLLTCHLIFHFWILVAFGNEVTKILYNFCLHFARQKNGRKENHTIEVTKIPKTKRRKYGMNKTLVYLQNIFCE